MNKNLVLVTGLIFGVICTRIFDKINKKYHNETFESYKEVDINENSHNNQESSKIYTATEVADIIGAKRSNISTWAAKLEEQGYEIERSNDSNRSRKYKSKDIEVLDRFHRLYKNGEGKTQTQIAKEIIHSLIHQ